MTGTASSMPVGSCADVAPELVAAYAGGALGTAAAWSVEAHLPGCAACRSALAAAGQDQERLDRNRSVLLVRLALPAAGPLERVAALCGVPPHLWRMLSVTPSLRGSWLAGVLTVLGAAIGAAYLIAPLAVGSAGTAGVPGELVPPIVLPYLILAPLLPLAGVAAAFHARLDPAADLATAAPVSGVWLFFVRSVSVMTAALVPTVLAAFVLPGSGWLPLLVILPALAISSAALALATVAGPLRAAVTAGAGWVAVVAGLGFTSSSPALAYAAPAQAVWLILIIGSGCVLIARRRVLELGWNR